MQSTYIPDIGKKLDRLRERAKVKGVRFEISRRFMQDLLSTRDCPCCTNRMNFETNHEFELTIDRLVPAHGYVENNVIALCRTCNGLKDNKSPSELKELGLHSIASWMDRECVNRRIKWKSHSSVFRAVTSFSVLDFIGRVLYNAGYIILHRKRISQRVFSERKALLEKYVKVKSTLPK